MAKEELKKCFVICPISEEGTEIRRRSDQVLNHIIKPVAKECGYETVRADQISEPGIITSQVIQHLLHDDLVIADLTARNPNVYYELAVRHAVRKAVVQIIHYDEPIPFDVAPTRTIKFDYQNLDSVAYCKEQLSKQIRTVERDPSKVDSPVSVAVDLQALSRSDNPLEKMNAEIITTLEDIKSMIVRLINESRPKLVPPERWTVPPGWTPPDRVSGWTPPEHVSGWTPHGIPESPLKWMPRETFPKGAVPGTSLGPTTPKPSKQSTNKKKTQPKRSPPESSEH